MRGRDRESSFIDPRCVQNKGPIGIQATPTLSHGKKLILFSISEQVQVLHLWGRIRKCVRRNRESV